MTDSTLTVEELVRLVRTPSRVPGQFMLTEDGAVDLVNKFMEVKALERAVAAMKSGLDGLEKKRT